MEALRVEKLHAGYGRGPDVVQGATLTLARGETAAILGPSGGGKSTLLKVMAGLLPPRSGKVEVLGADWPERAPRGSIGYVPQRLGLVRHASVFQNVVHGGLFKGPWASAFLGRVPPQVAADAKEAIRVLGLEGKEMEPVRLLSGGQQRRTAIAKAFVQKPRLLLADEFLGELDSATVDLVLGALERLQAETGMAVLMVEHQVDVALRAADSIYRLKGGQLTALEE